MNAPREQIAHYRSLHRETLEIFESIEKLGDRFSDPDGQLTEAEAEQSLDYLRSDLDRLSGELKVTQGKKMEHGGQHERHDDHDLLLPVMIGGLALGALLEK